MTTINNISNSIPNGTFSATNAVSSGTVSSTTSNTSNSGSSIGSQIISVAGTTAAYPYTRFAVGTTAQYAIGINSGSSNSFWLAYAANGATPASTGYIEINPAGYVNVPQTTLFYEYLSSTVNNVTGDGTVYTFTPNTSLYDNRSNFSGTNFTAPVTGKYYLQYSCAFSNWGAQTTGEMQLHATAATYYFFYINWGNFYNAPITCVCVSIFIPMTAGDTANCECYVQNSTKTVGLYGASDSLNCFSGYLVC
jgi:hypothetical protein